MSELSKQQLIKNSKIVLLKADANSEIGFGHVFRLIAMYDFLKDKFQCIFITKDLPETILTIFLSKKIDWKKLENDSEEELFFKTKNNATIVLDGYNFSNDYLRILKNSKLKIVKIDDFYDYSFNYDAIINHSPAAKTSKYKVDEKKLFLGLDYALLRNGFLDEAHTRSIKVKETLSVFVCFGGADPMGISKKVVEHLKKSSKLNSIHVVSEKPLNDSKVNNVKTYYYKGLDEIEMIRLIKKCDIAICPPSTISLEVCSLGVPLIVIPVVDNQVDIGKGLEKNKAAIKLELNQLENVNTVIESISTAKYIDLQKNQIELLDGNSKKRIVKIFENLC